MKQNSYAMNIFKIKSKLIPKFVYKCRLLKYFNNESEYFSEISKIGGVNLDRDNQIFLTFIKVPLSKDIKLEEKLLFQDLFSKIPTDQLEQLFSKYLRWDKKIEIILNENLQKVRKEKVIGKFSIRPYVRTEVKYINGNFYLVIDFRHNITSVLNLWEYVNKSKEELLKQVGKKIKFLLNPKRSYTIKKIEEPDPDIVDLLIRYYKDQGYIKSDKELRRFGEIDYNQPIMRCKEIPHPFLPQHCVIVFNLEELEGTSEANKFMEYCRLSNKEKFEVIKEVAKDLDIIESSSEKFQFEKMTPSDLIVKDEKGRSVKIKKTNTLFSWINRKHQRKLLPYEIPDLLKNKEITAFILIDEEIPEIKRIKNITIQMFQKYNKIKEFSDLPYFDFSKRIYQFNRKKVFEIIKQIKENLPKKKTVSFALIVGKELYPPEEDYYESLKRQLFQLRVISQNILWRNLIEDIRGYIKNNLLIQIMGKLGIKYFVLQRKVEYDYILGVDVGRGMYERHRIAGCTVVFDSEGKIRKILPVKTETPGETLNLPRIIEYLQNKGLLDFENKDVLILRDGKIQYKEREDLQKLSNNYSTKITFMNLKKSHNYKINTEKHGLGISFGSTAFLLPHSTGYGANPIKIDQKFRFEEGKEILLEIDMKDLELLYDFTRLNYSSLFNEKLSFKLPAPVHYADKFIKALGKGWEVDEDLLKQGCLYFI